MREKLIIGVSGLFLVIQSVQSWAQWRLENIKPITNKKEGWFMCPRWSPDGKKIAFTREKWRGIYLKNADGSGDIEKITENGSGCEIVWLPDSNIILFCVENQLKFKRVGSKGSKSVITMREGYVGPASLFWVPTMGLFYNTIKISNIEAERNEFSIIICDLEGNIKREIKSDIKSAGKISPDGSKIAYPEPLVRGKLVTFDTMRVWLTDAAGGNKKLVMEGSDLLPIKWAPDSKKLLIGRGWYMDVYMIESGEVFNLDRGDEMNWSPDGEWMVYVILEDDGHYITSSEIYIIRYDGTQKNQLTNTTDLIEKYPIFAPDGSKIAFSTLNGVIYTADIAKKEGEK